MKYLKITILFTLATFLLAACGQSQTEVPVSEASAPEPVEVEVVAELVVADIGAALAAANRSEEDSARDAGRKPVEVLNFLGVMPGMNVIDLMAAGGWYSEVLSAAVGEQGSVDAQLPPFMLGFRDGYYGNALNERIGDRLTNVTRVDSTWAELGASGTQYDFALSALNFHDAYYLQSPEAAAEMLASVYAVLKPGGVFGIIDHVGNADADNKSLHRIDKALAIELINASEFTIEDESSMLANSADDHTLRVFSEEVRGQTDRFLLKLRKPVL